jgi:uncharacterized protein YPO0396
LDPKPASVEDFLAKLQRLEMDGLPRHERRFFDLLKDQSHQNLASLNTHLRQARNEIRERMELVNEGLQQAEFNRGTFLRINAGDRPLPEIQEFKREIHDALSHARTEDREMAERRFATLRRLVERRADQGPQQRRWREKVLDVRQHVEFIACKDVSAWLGETSRWRSARERFHRLCRRRPLLTDSFPRHYEMLAELSTFSSGKRRCPSNTVNTTSRSANTL